MRQTRAFMFAVFAMLSGAAACSARDIETSAGEVALEDSAFVVVDNRNLNDFTIYILEGGTARRRLGRANALQTTRIPIPRSLIGNGRDLQFLADPFAASGNAVSQRIFVRPGDAVQLSILP